MTRHPLLNIAEWRKGCGNAVKELGAHPVDCGECTEALVAAIEKWFLEDNQPEPSAKCERVDGCADAAWLLFDLNYYDSQGCAVLDAAAIISKARAYAGYSPSGKGDNQ